METAAVDVGADTHDVADDAGRKRWRRGRLLLWRASAFATDALALETEADVGDGDGDGGGRWRWRWTRRAWTLAPDTHDVRDDAGGGRLRIATDALALETEAGVGDGDGDGGRGRWRQTRTTSETTLEAGVVGWRRRASAFATDALALETEAGVGDGDGDGRCCWRRASAMETAATSTTTSDGGGTSSRGKAVPFPASESDNPRGKTGELAAHR